MRQLPLFYFFSLFLLTLLAGCKTAAPVALPATTAVPTVFAPEATDTSSLARQPWRRFFADSNLVRLVGAALQSNPDLLVAVQRVEVARATLQEARGALLPSVDAVASAGVERYGEYTLNGIGNYDTNLSGNIEGRQRIPNPTPDYFLGLRSSWEIDLWGKLRSRRRAAVARLLATEQGRRAVQTALVAEVARLYYELLTLDSQRGVLGKNRELQERALEIIKLQKLGGRATELAVQQFTAQLLRTRSREVEVDQRITTRENTLNRLLGRYPQPIRRGAPIRQQAVPPAISVGLPSTLLLRRPDVREAELELQATRADVAAARAAFLPALTLTPYVGLNSFRATTLFSPTSLALGLLGGVAAPIFNRNALRANYTRATANQRAAYLNYQKAIQVSFEEVATGLTGFANYQRVYDLQEQEVAALTRAVSIADKLYTANYANYLEVITAQRGALEAELNLTTTRREQFMQLIDLYRATGGGWE